jgi:hypothetical protein
MTTFVLTLALVAQTPQAPTKMIPPPTPTKATPQATAQAPVTYSLPIAVPINPAIRVEAWPVLATVPTPVAACAPAMAVAEYAAAPVPRGGFFRFKQKTKIRQGLGLGLGHRRMRTAGACY